MKISLFKRAMTAYFILGKNFKTWFSPLISAILISLLRVIIFLGMFLDKLLFNDIRNKEIEKPIVIVGNPRSGTTFLHRFLVKNKLGVGSQLWQLLYPSVVIQKLIRPFLPILEKISPTRHHSTDAHKTSLQSVETDDASILFRYLDGFFLYGFIMCWSDNDLFSWFDPKLRDVSKRDYNWLKRVWSRTLHNKPNERIIAKLFSVSTNIPNFLDSFPDAKLLYMLRDPLSVIPSGLSLVTGVLDKRFGFWSLSEDRRQKYIDNLYKGLVELQIRFYNDWTSGKINRNNVMIVNFDKMMNDFDGLMSDIISFTNSKESKTLKEEILLTAKKQKEYVSSHKYDLSKFGITENQIRKDCSKIYDLLNESSYA